MPYLPVGQHVVDTKASNTRTTRRFGVELEVSSADHYSGLNGKTPFGLKGDCSVSGDGCEFYSPILQGDAGLAAVENLCDYAAEHEWECDDTCGYHLHIDVSDLDDEGRKRVLYAYKLTEGLWRLFVQRRRARNTYCRPLEITPAAIKSQTFDESVRYIDHNTSTGRYCWCNPLAFYDHGTIEIRLHHGTITKFVVINWIKAHLQFVETIRSLTIPQIAAMFDGKTADEAMLALERIFDNSSLVQHFRKRRSFHQRRATAAAAVPA